MKKKISRKALAWSLIVVVSISFLAPPVGTRSRAVHALAAVVSGMDDMFGEELSVSTQEDMGAESDAENGEETDDKTWLTGQEIKDLLDPRNSEAYQVLAETIAEAASEAVGELELMAMSEQDILTAEEIQQQIKGPKTAEELFYENVDWSSIPEALTVHYNPDFIMELSEEQLTVLERIVEAEAGDEDTYGKMLVANVVLNRVLDDEFPDTVKEVVFQNNGKTYQFSPVRKGCRYYTVTVSEHTKAAVARVLEGEDYSDGALYFFARRYTSAKKAKWFDTSLRKIVEYGCHEFFGNK